MNRSAFPIRSFVATAAAAALVAACGGGGTDRGGDASSALAAPASSAQETAAGTSAQPQAVAAAAATAADFDDTDGAGAANETEVAAILAPIDAATLSVDTPAARSGPQSRAAGEARRGRTKNDRYPGVKQTNLVANKPEFGAQILEPDLKNPWGIAIRPAGLGGHFWLAASNAGKSIQYVGDVGGTPLFQDDLKIVDTAGAPTGVVFNPGVQFVITQPHANGPITNAAKFIFANASGTITAWTERARAGGGVDQPVDSVTVADGTARHSTFLGVAVSPAADRMYAADFGAEAALRVYDGGFVEQAAFPNPFNRGAQPGGFEAFNVQTIGDSVFAMYGRHVPPDPNNAPPAEGRLAEFDANGALIAKWRGRGHLNYPWGVALAPKDFGLYGGCLLVGNFGDGTIVAFHPRLKVALDYVRDAHARRVVIDGLWGLQFGNGASLGEANHLYFAAGPNREADGLFGKLEPNPDALRHAGRRSLCR